MYIYAYIITDVVIYTVQVNLRVTHQYDSISITYKDNNLVCLAALLAIHHLLLIRALELHTKYLVFALFSYNSGWSINGSV